MRGTSGMLEQVFRHLSSGHEASVARCEQSDSRDDRTRSRDDPVNVLTCERGRCRVIASGDMALIHRLPHSADEFTNENLRSQKRPPITAAFARAEHVGTGGRMHSASIQYRRSTGRVHVTISRVWLRTANLPADQLVARRPQNGPRARSINLLPLSQPPRLPTTSRLAFSISPGGWGANSDGAATCDP